MEQSGIIIDFFLRIIDYVLVIQREPIIEEEQMEIEQKLKLMKF